MTFHIYSIINAILFGYLGQEVKLYKKVIKRKTRLFLLSFFSCVFLVGIIIFDIFELKSITTLIYDIVLSALMFWFLYFKNVDNYKIMQRASKKKEVKKLNIIFYIVCIFLLLFPFIAFGIYSLIVQENNFFIENQNIPYLLLGLIIYILIAFMILIWFGKKYYKHYQNQLEQEKLLQEEEPFQNEELLQEEKLFQEEEAIKEGAEKIK